MGEHDAGTEAFVEALRTAGTALAAVPALLEGARVHETAFGKLFEAAEVRDAYHQRLPETETDIAEALEVIEHFVAGLTGGHAIGTRGRGRILGQEPGGPLIPEQQQGGTQS
jgi:hypothetical protein